MRSRPLRERFEERYVPEPNSGCWIWTAGLNGDGYGTIRRSRPSRGVKGRHVGAHVAAYEMFVGPVPVGKELDHRCRVRCCVNPAHLEPVEHAENIRRGAAHDAIRATFAARTHCLNGHEFAAGNVYWATSRGRLVRDCLTCRRARHARGTAQKKLKQQRN